MPITKPRKGWSKLLKEFLIDSFDADLPGIISDKASFIEIVKAQFPGTKLSKNLLNAYICRYRKGLLILKDRQPRISEATRKPFHREAFLELLRKEASNA